MVKIIPWYDDYPDVFHRILCKMLDIAYYFREIEILLDIELSLYL